MPNGENAFSPANAPPRRRQVLVAGAGIAGLCAALSLEKRGFAVTVFERSLKMPEEGAGLQLSPNASRLLHHLNVLPHLDARATVVKCVSLMSGREAAPLLRLDVSEAQARWGAPYLAVHRADLAAALMAQVRQRPAISVLMGAEVTHFAAHTNGVTVSLTGAGGISEAEGIFLIGADGVRSLMRAELSGIEAADSGLAAYRTMVSGSDALPPALRELAQRREAAVFLAPNAHLVAYPLRGGRALNLVAIGKSGAAGPQRGTSLPPAEFDQLEAGLSSFLRGASDWTCWPILTVTSAARWSDGKRLALIGDAAHAMAPYGAQGAAMAIEDAWTISACLAAHRDDIPAAVASYEKLRRPRIRRVAARTRANRFAYHSDGAIAKIRNALFHWRSQKMLNGLDWIYGFDAEAQRF